MTKPKKPRNKRYVSKGASPDPLSIFGGMGSAHHAHLRRIQTLNHMAMADMAQGRGTREQWNRIVGAINIANVLCEQGVGDEFRETTIAARDALLALGKRAVKNDDRFVFTGDEMRAINEALDCHDAQLENTRAIDIDRAADTVAHRVRHRINSTSVMREIRQEAASFSVPAKPGMHLPNMQSLPVGTVAVCDASYSQVTQIKDAALLGGEC